MKYFILLFIVPLAVELYGQTSMDLYNQSEDLYQTRKYNLSLGKLTVCESSLTSSNAVIEHLKVKCYYELKEYDKAEKALVNFFKYKASESLVDEMTAYAKKIRTAKISLVKEKLIIERKQFDKDISELSNNIFAKDISAIEEETKELKMAVVRKENDALIEQDLQFLESLKEGYFYYFNDKKITSAYNEVSLIAFFDNEYIIVTIPDFNNLHLLKTTNTSVNFRPSTNLIDGTSVLIRQKGEDHWYRLSNYYDNLALKYDGKILWNGQQHERFEYQVFYYPWQNTLIGDFLAPRKLNKNIYTPYFEKGTFRKWYNFDLVNKKTQTRLKNLGFSNYDKGDNSLKVLSSNMRGIASFFIYHKNNYYVTGQNTATYYSKGAKYKKEYLVCMPESIDAGYGLKNYVHPNSSTLELTSNIGELVSESLFFTRELFDLYYKELSLVPGGGYSGGQDVFRYFLGPNSKGFIELLEILSNNINNPSKVDKQLISKPKEIKTYHSNGNLKKTGYKDAQGNDTGLWKDYYETGELKATYECTNDKLNGEMINYYKNGKIKSSDHIINNVSRGEYKFYNESGTLLKDQFWGTPGESASYFNEFHPNGQIKKIARYDKNGGLTEWKMYHSNGVIKLEGFCKGGKLLYILSNKDSDGNDLEKGTLTNGNGTVNIYDDKGNLQETYTYLDGVKQ